MSRKTSEYKSVLILLENLHRKYPTYGLGRHISTALADYGDFWGISDREFLYALKKYQAELELDSDNIASSEYVDKIVKDAQDLSNILDDEEEGEYGD